MITILFSPVYMNRGFFKSSVKKSLADVIEPISFFHMQLFLCEDVLVIFMCISMVMRISGKKFKVFFSPNVKV